MACRGVRSQRTGLSAGNDVRTGMRDLLGIDVNSTLQRWAVCVVVAPSASRMS